MMEEGVSIGVSIYHKACELLNDDDESVRYISIKLVHSLGLSLKERYIMYSYRMILYTCTCTKPSDIHNVHVHVLI